MKLGDLCSAPCFAHAPDFVIPEPKCSSADLKFAREDGRDYYAVLLSNHDLSRQTTLSPRIAIVGLSPAGNQIGEFTAAYRRTGNYASASVAGGFAGLAPAIIKMLKGLGAAEKLSLSFPDSTSLAHHREVYCTSLIACASLTSDGSSDDFDPSLFPAARRCITERFVAEITNPAFNELSHIFILGTKGWAAVETIPLKNGKTVLQYLRSLGKVVLNLPHPSGQNQEYVKLASLAEEDMPTLDEYLTRRWREYAAKPPRKGRAKESEASYKAKRATVWHTVNQLRKQFAHLERGQ
jgi:hypothetical protein